MIFYCYQDHENFHFMNKRRGKKALPHMIIDPFVETLELLLLRFNPLVRGIY
jgi:hypothetical protein